jgi:very-short-patch-repair endonuclease
MKRSKLEDALAFQLRAAGVELHETEYRFAKDIGRRWRFDLAWPARKLAVEIDGGLFVFGRHSRGAGQLADMEKYAEATLRGWRVLRVGAPHIRSGQALEWIERALREEAA